MTFIVSIFSAIGTALFLYVATNIDEYFLGLLFIVQPGITKKDIWVGKFLAILVVAGIALLFALLIQTFAIPIEIIGLLGFLPLTIGIRAFLGKEEDELEESAEKIKQMAGRAGWVSVGLVHIASGGDNIGLYVPAFATASPLELVVIAIVFLSLTALWAASPYWILKNEVIREKLEEWGERLFPWLMIVLAVMIFWDTGLFGWLFALVF